MAMQPSHVLDISKLNDLRNRLDTWEHNERIIGNHVDVYDFLDQCNCWDTHNPYFLILLDEVCTTPEEIRELLLAIEDCLI